MNYEEFDNLVSTLNCKLIRRLDFSYGPHLIYYLEKNNRQCEIEFTNSHIIVYFNNNTDYYNYDDFQLVQDFFKTSLE